MRLEKMFRDMNKVIPFKKIAPMFIFMGAIFLYSIIMTIYYETKPNKSFYKATIIGEVDDIRNEEPYIWYKIGSNWFVLLNYQIKDLSIGDSIYKRNHSFMIEIYDKGGKVKYEDEIKDIVFKISETEP